jgi:hypothetical protein
MRRPQPRGLISHKFNVPPEIRGNVHAASAWDPKKPSDPELQKLLDDIAVLWESADEKSRRQITTRLKTLAYESVSDALECAKQAWTDAADLITTDGLSSRTFAFHHARYRLHHIFENERL